MKKRTSSEILNILHNLNQLENAFLDEVDEASAFVDFETYFNYLNNYTIVKNHLASVYFMQVSDDKQKILTNLETIDEALTIYSGQNLNIFKSFNFPASHVHSASYFECIYVMEGSANFEIANHHLHLKAGDFLFHPPHEKYLLNALPNSIVIDIEIRRSYIFSEYQHLFSNVPAALSFFEHSYQNNLPHNYLLFHTKNNYEFIELTCEMLAESLNEDDKLKKEIIQGYFEQMIRYLKRYTIDHPETLEHISAKQNCYNEIAIYLKTNYQTASLDSVADHIGFSKNYISRIVRHETNDSFLHLLNSIRIDAVKEYLKETTLRLEEIAELTGLSDASYLWRIFRKSTGMSPSDYREKYYLYKNKNE